MKIILSIIAAIAMAVMPCAAATFDYLVFEHTDGTVSSFSVNGLKITPSDTATELTVINNEQSATLQVAMLSRAYFTNEESGIAAPGAALPKGVKAFNLKGIKATKYDGKGIVIIRHDDGTTTKTIR